VFNPGLGSGGSTKLQLEPFQRSVKGTAEVPTWAYPTAVHAVAEVHDTPCREPLVPPLGSGGCIALQLKPSQRSAKSTSPEDPTAMHAVADVHETPFRIPGVFEVDSNVQPKPFQ
jgi:hypothetical protein